MVRYRLSIKRLFAAGIVVCAAFLLAAPGGAQAVMTGRARSELTALDNMMAAIMRKYDLPGGQLAVAKDGRLVHSRGYGYADVERKRKVQIDSLFRIGSVSKTVTQVAILTLVDRGLLGLEEKAFRILHHLKPPRGAAVDPRLLDITVRDLLKHEGGWDTSKSFDPMFLPWSRKAAVTLGEKDPPSCETIIRYMMGVPLDFDPRTRQAYSNFGYCVLGRIVETTLATKASKQSAMRNSFSLPCSCQLESPT